MKKLVAAGLCLIIGVQALAMMMPDRRYSLVIIGIAVAMALLALRFYLAHLSDEPQAPIKANDAEESLRRWLSRTETQIQWAESTRSDWDRHLRPMLARQFGIATGQKQNKNPDGFRATGRMLFGDELWAWVDPENIARTDAHVPGPGREALDEILRRLERV
ncbi:hypothetical protein [Mycobacterium sp. 1274761.0]|uniref:hypothetical protein n=1 Tax=Mycobacterium sp. 1274761.0 TaxID=1834077 RepID=UPI0007FC3D22|nr:hypothetical protein [Mycobacterium sp. 1274761.0]OBK71805.1 hypothetical protein A5651_18175 [Mycobacterium sp. 1274761.0]